MTHRPFLNEAHACRIHGAIKASGGKTSVEELADGLGIARTTVRDIIYAKHWGRRLRRPSPQPIPADPSLEAVELVFE